MKHVTKTLKKWYDIELKKIHLKVNDDNVNFNDNLSLMFVNKIQNMKPRDMETNLQRALLKRTKSILYGKGS